MRTPALVSFVLVVAVTACGPSRPSDDDDDVDAPPVVECSSEGEHRCVGLDFQTCLGGSWETSATCQTGCNINLGCVVCQPGTGTCNGNTSTACLPDGSGYFDEFCDPVMGSSCDAVSGTCVGACTVAALGSSYIGCDYYATQTSQLVNPSFQFAIAVSNTTGNAATVTIEGGVLGGAVTLTVGPNSVATQYLPWVPGLKRCMTENFFECGVPESYGGLVVDGAYHVRSTQPVTVYQFSALDYAYGGKFSYSNDASLLLPTTSWTGNYVVPAWPMWDPNNIGIALPPMPSTTTRAATHGGDGAPSFAAGVPQTVTLNAGDVIQLMSDTGDLSGSVVSADKPVQVIGAHHCTQVPLTARACDHIEESVFPVEVLSTEYLVTAPFLPTIGGPRNQVTRIFAAEPGVTATLDPAIGGPYTLANPGDFVEIAERVEDFKVTGTGKLIVTHYMEGQDAPGGGGSGDPDMTLAVPIDQYRLSYLFHAPTNYDGGNYVNITAPAGAVVMLDGAPVNTFTPIGASGYGIARVPLSNAGNGSHTAFSTVPFGISVYGYGQYTSYWYPGGLDTRPIVIE
jgi:hypothetical protein